MEYKILSEQYKNGIIKTIEGMIILAEELHDVDLMEILDRHIDIDKSYYDSNDGDKLYVVNRLDIEGLKDELTDILPYYSREKNDGKTFSKRLYSSVQELKIMKILAV